jgi:hypothetical protein
MRNTQEFNDAMDMFERSLAKSRIYVGTNVKDCRAKRVLGGKPPSYFYENGKVDELFRMFLEGYAFGKCVCRE